MNDRTWLILFVAGSVGWILGQKAAAADAVDKPAFIHFQNGDYARGRLLDSVGKDSLTWQADGFVRPLQFPFGCVHSVRFQRAIDRSELTGPYCFELSGGDSVFGQLVSLDDHQAVLDIAGLGKLHVERSRLHRFYRVSASDLIFAGPGGLEGWKTAGPDKAWRDEAGQLGTDQPGASIRREVRPLELTRYEFELAWNGAPNFELAVGLGDTEGAKPAFCVETWGDEMVITRESETRADLAVLQKISPSPGQLRFLVLLDQPKGRLLAYSSAGEKLADFAVPNEKASELPQRRIAKPGMVLRAPTQKPELPGGLKLTNRRGDIQLVRLTVSRWSGLAPRSATLGLSTIHLTDGTMKSMEVKSLDAAKRQLVAVYDGQEHRIDERQLQDVILAPPMDEEPRAVRVLLTSGVRLSGALAGAGEASISLHVPGIQESLNIPVTELQSILNGNRNPVTADEEPSTEALHEVRVDLPGTWLRGRLVETNAEDAALVFQPQWSAAASPLADNVSGKLILHTTLLPPKATTSPKPTPSPALQFVNGIRTMLGVQQQPAMRPAPPGDCLLHLRSGDTLPCRVQFIDERGVTFKSPVTDADFVPHERIKALELRLDARPVKIEKPKFERLLTLPRMQRDNPPEHLVRSLEGDYLRGRLLAMNDRELHVELRLETKAIDRSQVSRILWLHPDEAAKASVSQPQSQSSPQAPRAGIRVQAVPQRGNRLTFIANKLSGNTLSGESELLGPCRVNLDQTDQLLLGSAIEEAAPTLAFHQWKLRPAAEPLPDPDPGSDPSGGAGMESVLVGKDAPAIDLELLDGQNFRLAERKGKVVILDFWASWCGPCLQVMPQIESVAREFADQGVELVSINLQESPDRIKTTLDRLKLETAVALDKEGRVAERYGATSIPQTVIVDRNGKVARFFVGVSARFDEQLRQALQSVLHPPLPSSAD